MKQETWMQLFGLIFLTALSTSAASLSMSQHPINTEEDTCLSTANDTLSQKACIEKAIHQWDKEMNTIYGKLMQSLPGSLKSTLKNSQHQWLTQKDTELKFVKAYYGQEKGTIWPIVELGQMRDFIKSRVQILYGLYESKDLSGESASGYLFWPCEPA